MAVTYFGSASNVADNSAGFDDAAYEAITPPASMVTGDLALVLAAEATSSGAITVGTTGGQIWTSLTSNESASPQICQRLFWCRFNGTWSTNPTFAPAHVGDFQDFSAIMVVFRPSSGANLWSVDVAESAATYTAPGTPFDVTTTGQTAIGTSGVFVNIDTCVGVPTWAIQTGGWSNPTNTQWRNSANNLLSTSIAYKIFTGAGASGSVTNRQSVTGYAGWKSIITFAETVSNKLLPAMMENA
jgi:hypothetical protein